jgi:hypothetical protein
MGKYKQYLIEKFYKSDNIKGQHYKGYVELFQNPSHQELNSLYKLSFDNGIRIGVDKSDNIYAWIEDVLHSDIKKEFKLNFKLRFEYTRNFDTLFLASGETEKNFKKNINDKLLKQFKQLFSKIKQIEMTTSPFKKVYTYK